jgi:ATP-dependent Clp protease adaptor protein ClpS
MSREDPARVAPPHQQTQKPRATPTRPAKPASRTQPVTRLLPPHAVILHNDPINGFGFVVDTLMKVFRYNGGKAFWLTLKAHTAGRTIVWAGNLEVAELKAEQVRACGPDPAKIAEGATPLRVTTQRLVG